MKIIESLIETQNILGESYLKIGDLLQKLKIEVDGSLSESETVIEEFRNNLANTSEKSLSSVIFLLEENVKEAQKKHKEYTEGFVSVMSRIFDSFEVLNKMHHPIGEIIKSAEQMELLALNAMVVAIQAGKHGGGFTCITDGFQKNAKNTFYLAGNLNTQRGIVYEHFDKLKNKSEGILILQRKIASIINSALTSDFSALKKSISSAVDFIEAVYNEAQKIKPAVLSVFEGLQNQDIIRQSVDHILLSLEELEKLKFNRNTDEVTYLSKKIYDLSIFVLDEVTDQLDNDEAVLKSNIDKMITLLKELQKKKEGFAKEQFNADSEVTNLIGCLNGMSTTLEGVVSESENICGFETELIKHKNLLLNAFAQLHDFITAFADPVSMFNHTIVLAKIEIARHPIIANVETSINDIQTEVDIISESAKQIENIYDNFNNLNKATDTELKKIINDNKIFTENFKNEIKKLAELSEQSGYIFRELLNKLTFLNSSFVMIYENIKKNIGLIVESKQSLKIMKGEIIRSLEEINQSYNMIGKERLAVLTRSSEIDNLLNKFTIFRHKGKIMNEEIFEQSVSESSITLF